MREVRRDKRTTATADMPSSCQTEIPKRTQEKMKPRKRTMVRGARVLDLRGLSEVRRIVTTRMECSGQELASLYAGG